MVKSFSFGALANRSGGGGAQRAQRLAGLFVFAEQRVDGRRVHQDVLGLLLLGEAPVVLLEQESRPLEVSGAHREVAHRAEHVGEPLRLRVGADDATAEVEDAGDVPFTLELDEGQFMRVVTGGCELFFKIAGLIADEAGKCPTRVHAMNGHKREFIKRIGIQRFREEFEYFAACLKDLIGIVLRFRIQHRPHRDAIHHTL